MLSRTTHNAVIYNIESWPGKCHILINLRCCSHTSVRTAILVSNRVIDKDAAGFNCYVFFVSKCMQILNWGDYHYYWYLFFYYLIGKSEEKRSVESGHQASIIVEVII